MRKRQPRVPERRASNDILDSAAVERLQRVAFGRDPTLMGRLIGLFLEDTPGRLMGLAQAYERQDDAAMRAVAHTLRGGAETFGASEMAAHCSFVEHMPSEWEAAEIQSHLDALTRAFNRTRIALLQLMELPPLTIV